MNSWQLVELIKLRAYLAGSINLPEEESQQRDDDEVHAASEVRQLVELEDGCDKKEHELDRQDCDARDGEVVSVEDVHCHRKFLFRVCRLFRFANQKEVFSCHKFTDFHIQRSFLTVYFHAMFHARECIRVEVAFKRISEVCGASNKFSHVSFSCRVATE